jgi:hypothetical protein
VKIVTSFKDSGIRGNWSTASPGKLNDAYSTFADLFEPSTLSLLSSNNSNDDVAAIVKKVGNDKDASLYYSDLNVFIIDLEQSPTTDGLCQHPRCTQ